VLRRITSVADGRKKSSPWLTKCAFKPAQNNYASALLISTPVQTQLITLQSRCTGSHATSSLAPTRQNAALSGASGAPFTHGTANFSIEIFQRDVLQAFLVPMTEQFSSAGTGKSAPFAPLTLWAEANRE